ncbi:hypothetical protein CR513_14183, partial [Mucuna pruriens]
MKVHKRQNRQYFKCDDFKNAFKLEVRILLRSDTLSCKLFSGTLRSVVMQWLWGLPVPDHLDIWLLDHPIYLPLCGKQGKMTRGGRLIRYQISERGTLPCLIICTVRKGLRAGQFSNALAIQYGGNKNLRKEAHRGRGRSCRLTRSGAPTLGTSSKTRSLARHKPGWRI